jgi:diguanylate cyclase (GGDEF)-like protein/PAS domain S-box-containing protein
MNVAGTNSRGSNGLNRGDGIPIALELSSDPTETIDLDNLFSKELSSSGSFDVKGLKKTSFAKLLLALPLPAMLVDHSYFITFCNEAWGRITRNYAKLECLAFIDLLADSNEAQAFCSLLATVYEKRKSKIIQAKLVIDDKPIWARMYLRPIRLVKERYILVLVEDLTLERRQLLLMDGIRRAKQEWERTFDTVPDFIATVDDGFRITRLNKAMADRASLPVQKAVGQACYKVIHGAEKPPPFCPLLNTLAGDTESTVEYYEEHLGGYFKESLSPVNSELGRRIGCVLVVRDITDRKELEKQLHHHAIHDPLTNLFNRRHFFELLNAAFQTARRYSLPLSLCICDIDRFKDVNDTYGHQAGDVVLQTFGKILLGELRQSDVSARYGGDEFIIAMPHTPADKAAECMDRIRAGLEAFVFQNDVTSYSVTCSVGIAELFDDHKKVDALISAADRALYAAKERGRNRILIHRTADKP